MKPILILLLFISFTTNCLFAQKEQLEIKLIKQDTFEIHTKKQLLKLLSIYDIKKWVFTKNINIESGYNVIPHSMPILTLNTRHIKDDDLLLATFIHEQLHWYISYHKSKNELLAQLKLMYPNPKINFPEGSGGEIDTYFHILICHLEYNALKELLGELKASQIMIFWSQDHYKWVYKTVLDDHDKLNNLARKYNLNL
ncbi:hypothetical protein [Flavobacterium luteum]|uniref:Uncharacterized protein n=1 Tax=Flavobacterium luteum TaxID=2026654 RepID=A0A7J5AJL5_9FLAO|nr:hypothetical protein [Flavobacterium luteum]KAB1157784.1 hypothetical protein F6464_01490 [Flavobacterium luteum]